MQPENAPARHHGEQASTAGAITAETAIDDVKPPVFRVRDLAVSYRGVLAIAEVNLDVAKNEITSFIGPSGCGKSTVLRCFNRMNDLIQGARVDGEVLYHGVDLYTSTIDPVAVRRRIGMVFQKPNPFPKSIFDNVAFGPRVAGTKAPMSELVERSLRNAGLWDEVKDRLSTSALALSAASSNGCASPEPSPYSQTCCSWMSRAPPWIPSPPASSKNLWARCVRITRSLL